MKNFKSKLSLQLEEREILILTFDPLLHEKRYFHVYQPLFSLLDWSIYGYEGLLRSESKINPEVVFDFAKKSGILYELDTLSIYKALFTFSKYTKKMENILFVNIFPSTLTHPSFFYFLENLLKKVAIPCHQIVLEINEGEEIEDLKTFRQSVYRIKDYGFLIAIDDLGKGVSDLQKLSELEPNYVKLDRYFSGDLSRSVKKQKLISLIIDFYKEDAVIILEGIEEAEDLATAKLLGIPFAQGFLLGKPCALSRDGSQFLEDIY